MDNHEMHRTFRMEKIIEIIRKRRGWEMHVEADVGNVECEDVSECNETFCDEVMNIQVL
jgi:hypothetical protein